MIDLQRTPDQSESEIERITRSVARLVQAMLSRENGLEGNWGYPDFKAELIDVLCDLEVHRRDTIRGS